jgi:predicted dehydrogenase
VNEAHRPRLAVVGCGDVALRRYLPTLAALAGSIDLVACCDADAGRARTAVAECGGWAPRVRAARDFAEVARSERLDGVFNLTPPRAHARVTSACLDAGVPVFSEKPLATDLDAARALASRAAAHSTLLLCAPAVMATARFRWLAELLASGRLGRVTLAVGQLANLGPAAWRAYTGDAGAYYRSGGGPLLDQGVYVLHAIVGLLGPARRVQALAATAMPERTSTARSAPGRRISVEVADHWLFQLDFGDGVLGQVLASFAVAASRAPLLELHCERGSISVGESPPLSDAGPVDIYLREERPALEGWMEARPPEPPRAADSMIGAGAAHFVGCLTGREAPVLTADRALHVLEIALKSEASAARGQTLPLETSFAWP